MSIKYNLVARCLCSLYLERVLLYVRGRETLISQPERILGSGQFVERIIQKVDLAQKYRCADLERKEKAIDTIKT